MTEHVFMVYLTEDKLFLADVSSFTFTEHLREAIRFKDVAKASEVAKLINVPTKVREVKLETVF